MEELEWQTGTHGLEPTMAPRYTMTRTRRLPRKIESRNNVENAIDAALGHRYPCCGIGRGRII